MRSLAWDAIQDQSFLEDRSVSLFSRLRAVVSGDDYLDGEYDDELDYDGGQLQDTSSTPAVSYTHLTLPTKA